MIMNHNLCWAFLSPNFAFLVTKSETLQQKASPIWRVFLAHFFCADLRPIPFSKHHFYLALFLSFAIPRGWADQMSWKASYPWFEFTAKIKPSNRFVSILLGTQRMMAITQKIAQKISHQQNRKSLWKLNFMNGLLGSTDCSWLHQFD